MAAMSTAARTIPASALRVHTEPPQQSDATAAGICSYHFQGRKCRGMPLGCAYNDPPRTCPQLHPAYMFGGRMCYRFVCHRFNRGKCELPETECSHYHLTPEEVADRTLNPLERRLDWWPEDTDMLKDLFEDFCSDTDGLRSKGIANSQPLLQAAIALSFPPPKPPPVPAAGFPPAPSPQQWLGSQPSAAAAGTQSAAAPAANAPRTRPRTWYTGELARSKVATVDDPLGGPPFSTVDAPPHPAEEPDWGIFKLVPHVTDFREAFTYDFLHLSGDTGNDPYPHREDWCRELFEALNQPALLATPELAKWAAWARQVVMRSHRARPGN